MHDLADAFVSHVTPGRLRVKILSKKGDTTFFSSLAERLSRCAGIDRVEANALTGSVLFLHTLHTLHTVEAEVIAGYGDANHFFRLEKRKPQQTTISRSISETFKSLNKEVANFTGGEINLPGAAFLALLAMGIYQISRGNFVAIPWYTAFWYAMNIFLKAQSDKGVKGT